MLRGIREDLRLEFLPCTEEELKFWEEMKKEQSPELICPHEALLEHLRENQSWKEIHKVGEILIYHPTLSPSDFFPSDVLELQCFVVKGDHHDSLILERGWNFWTFVSPEDLETRGIAEPPQWKGHPSSSADQVNEQLDAPLDWRPLKDQLSHIEFVEHFADWMDEHKNTLPSCESRWRCSLDLRDFLHHHAESKMTHSLHVLGRDFRDHCLRRQEFLISPECVICGGRPKNSSSSEEWIFLFWCNKSSPWVIEIPTLTTLPSFSLEAWLKLIRAPRLFFPAGKRLRITIENPKFSLSPEGVPAEEGWWGRKEWWCLACANDPRFRREIELRDDEEDPNEDHLHCVHCGLSFPILFRHATSFEANGCATWRSSQDPCRFSSGYSSCFDEDSWTLTDLSFLPPISGHDTGERDAICDLCLELLWMEGRLSRSPAYHHSSISLSSIDPLIAKKPSLGSKK